MAYEFKLNLGDEVRDRITGYKGVAGMNTRSELAAAAWKDTLAKRDPRATRRSRGKPRSAG